MKFQIVVGTQKKQARTHCSDKRLQSLSGLWQQRLIIINAMCPIAGLQLFLMLSSPLGPTGISNV